MKYLPLIAIVFFASCLNIPVTNFAAKAEQKPLTYEDILKAHVDSIKRDNDTTFLGFVLGSSKEQTVKHLKQLMRESKTFKSESKDFSTRGIAFNVTGYPYTVYLENNTELPGVFELKYMDKKLLGIDFQIYENFDTEKVKELITSKYGPSVNETSKTSGKTYTWLINNTEIQVVDGGFRGFGEIGYFDLKRKLAYLKDIKGLKTSVEQLGQKITKKDI